jgi:branched-chain amino acid transport system substrate-binding protein
VEFGRATLKPAGLDKSTGVIVGDPTDPQWDNNKGMKSFWAFIDKYMPGVDIADTNYLFGYTQGMLLERLIRQCGNDLSRENIIKQAKNLKDLILLTVLPGIRINTSDKINMNYTQMRLQSWTGTRWDQFSEVLDAASE